MLRMQPLRTVKRRMAAVPAGRPQPTNGPLAAALSWPEQKQSFLFTLRELCRDELRFLQQEGVLLRPVEHRLTGLMNEFMETYAATVEVAAFDRQALIALSSYFLSLLQEGGRLHKTNKPAIEVEWRLSVMWVRLEQFLLHRKSTSAVAQRIYSKFRNQAREAFADDLRREATRFLLMRKVIQIDARLGPPAPATPRALRLPSPQPFFVRDDLDELSPLSSSRCLPMPYDEVLRLSCTSYQQAPSVHRQLRFFAALEDVAKPFSIATYDEPTIVVLPKNCVNKKMRDVIRRDLFNPGKIFVLRMHDGAAAQLHGDEQSMEAGQIGQSLAYLSEDFTRSLSLIWKAVNKDEHHPLLRKLFAEISGWCFDASLVKLSQFVEENFADDIDALAPNLTKDMTHKQQMYEYLRVFRIRSKRQFAADTGLASEDERGELHPQFTQSYFHDEHFRDYLRAQDAFADLPLRQVRKMVMQVIVEDLLPRLPFQPSAFLVPADR